MKFCILVESVSVFKGIVMSSRPYSMLSFPA